MAHTAGCYCIAIDPMGRYFAVGSVDSLVSLWDISEMMCIRTFMKLEWPVRTISFNHTGEYIASASEDPFFDISNCQTGRSVHQFPCKAAMDSVEWNPNCNLLAYAGDDENKYQIDEDFWFREQLRICSLLLGLEVWHPMFLVFLACFRFLVSKAAKNLQLITGFRSLASYVVFLQSSEVRQLHLQNLIVG